MFVLFTVETLTLDTNHRKQKKKVETNSWGHGTAIIRNTLNSNTHFQLNSSSHSFIFAIAKREFDKVFASIYSTTTKMKHSFIEHVIVVLFAESHKFHVPNGLRLNDFWSLVKWNIMKTVYLTKIEEKEKTGTFKQIMFQISHIPMSSSVSSLSIFVVVCFMPFTTNEQWINWYLNKMKLNCLKKIMCVIFRFDFGDFSQYKRVKFDIDWSINQLIFPKMFVAFMVVGNIVEFPYQIDIFCDGSMVFQCVLGWHNTYYHWRWLRHMMIFPQNWSVFHIGSMGVISSIDWICVAHSRSRFQYIQSIQ